MQENYSITFHLKKKKKTLPHLLTLQALYQPPYSPYGVLSLCLPLGVNKGEEEKRSGRMDCDAQNWIINGSNSNISLVYLYFSLPYSSPPFLLHASRWAYFQLQTDGQKSRSLQHNLKKQSKLEFGFCFIITHRLSSIRWPFH